MATYTLYTAKDPEAKDCFVVTKDNLVFSCRVEDMVYDVSKLTFFYKNLPYSADILLANFLNLQEQNSWEDDATQEAE